MSITRKQLHYSAIFGAVVAASFIGSEIAIIFLGLVNLFLGGILQNIAYGICLMGICWFWLWFYRHVYHVELALQSDGDPDVPN